MEVGEKKSMHQMEVPEVDVTCPSEYKEYVK